ncbi:MAG: disulfide oxidoreductase [Patescibacteria group bacterium]|nr:disulfide oxidoreductase [Patescibacteria group bacterium]
MSAEKRFYSQMSVADALDAHSKAHDVFERFHLGYCTTCPSAQSDTLEHICTQAGVNLDDFLKALEDLLAETAT